MPDANRPLQPQPPENVYRSPQVDIEGLESFGDEPAPTPPATFRVEPMPTQASTSAPKPAPASRRRRSYSLFLPLAFICVGAVMLLSNLGYLPNFSWAALWRLWPLILIGMGIDALIGRQTRLGSVVGTLLVLALLAAGATFFFVLYGAQIPAWIQSIQ